MLPATSTLDLQTEVAPAEAPLLRIQNLCVTYLSNKLLGGGRENKAVDDVSLDVKKSEVLSLVGESGSGKTTLARCILRLTQPTSGSIKYNGTDVWKLSGRDMKRFRREVQVVYQDPYESLNPRQDVLTTIGIPIKKLLGEKKRGSIEEMVVGLLKEVELDPQRTLYKLPHQLSGGERQRVNIARALATEPELLVADEPVTMLDATQRLNVLTLLLKLREKRKLTLLMITHDLASAKVTSQRTAIMYRGKLVELGETTKILSMPKHPYVEMIMRSVPQMGQPLDLSQIDSKMISMDEFGQGEHRGCVFLSRCMYSTDVCRTTAPPLEEKEILHYAACHNPLNASHKVS